MYRRKWLFFAIILVFLIGSGCSQGEPQRDNEANDPATIIQRLIVQRWTLQGSRVSAKEVHVDQVKPYKGGYLALAHFSGEGLMLSLFGIMKDSAGQWMIAEESQGDQAISMGFVVNRLVDENKTVLFGNMHRSTWIPTTGERKPTNYAKIHVVMSDATAVSEKVEGQEGYIVIVNSTSSIDKMDLVDAKGTLVSSLQDLSDYGRVFTDVQWRRSH